VTGENGGRRGSLYMRGYITDVLRFHERGRKVRVEKRSKRVAHMAITVEERQIKACGGVSSKSGSYRVTTCTVNVVQKRGMRDEGDYKRRGWLTREWKMSMKAADEIEGDTSEPIKSIFSISS
jgi:hypothetical protein